MHEKHPLCLNISYEWPRGIVFGGFWHVIDRTTKLKRCINGPISAIFQSTLKMGESVTIKSQSLPDMLYLWRMKNTFGHFMGIMYKIKAEDQAMERNNMAYYLLENTRNIQHLYKRSLILIVTFHAALERSGTIAAVCCISWKQFCQISHETWSEILRNTNN